MTSASFTVLLVGRPNVGKSTLFNRLIGKKHAIVEDTPGVTRDWREGEGRIGPFRFQVIDTAGLDDSGHDPFSVQALGLTATLLRKAQLVLFLVDGRSGIIAADRHFAQWLRKQNVLVQVVVNKCEGKNAAGWLAETERLGFGEAVGISAAHGEGLVDLYETMSSRLGFQEPTDAAPPKERDDVLRIAIMGRPNAGKSTLLNQLLGEERVLTSDIAGTTRDSIMATCRWGDTLLEIVDTAGIRRRSRVQESLEKMAVDSSLQALKYTQVAVLLLDATMGLEHQDITIAEMAVREGRALVVAINKCDKMSDEKELLKQFQQHIQNSFYDVGEVAVVSISALHQQGLSELIRSCKKVARLWSTHIATPLLNQWLEKALADHPLPLASTGRRVRIKYITQAKTRPPTFTLFCNYPKDIEGSYLRYLQKSLRDYFDLPGTVIRFIVKKSKNPYGEGA